MDDSGWLCPFCYRSLGRGRLYGWYWVCEKCYSLPENAVKLQELCDGGDSC